MDTKEAKKRVHKIVLTGGNKYHNLFKIHTSESHLEFPVTIGHRKKKDYLLVPKGHPIIHMFHGNSISPLTFQDPAAEKQPDNLDYVLSLKIWDGSGGIKFSDLSADEGLGGPRGHDDLCANLKGYSSEAFKFQENLLKTMIQIENTFSELGRSCERDCLIICDRGAMDASAFISPDKWDQLIAINGWNNVELRDNRYNHIVHMVSAANGAVEFYSTEDHACRSEGVELAQELDCKAAAAWIGHPYFDVIDNTTDFESKMKRMIASVCQKIGLDTGDRLSCNSKKLKFLIMGPLPPDTEFPPFQDFDVVHNYLQNNGSKTQARLRKRGQKEHWSYTYTIRRPHLCGQSVEVKTQLTHKDYTNRLEQKDKSHFTIRKKRRCFIINNQYYQLDIYKDPGHQRCEGLILLETYSAHEKKQLLGLLPQFLTIEKEVTGNPDYSMFNLSLLEEWKTSKQFCRGPMTNGTDEKEESSSQADSRTSLKMTLKITNGATETPEQMPNPKLTNGTSYIYNETNGSSNGTSNGTKNGSSSRTTNEASKNGVSKRPKTNGIHKPEAKRAINGKV